MTDATDTPDRLHEELKDRLRWLCSLFGQPSDLLRVLAVAEWRRLRTWVRGLEALATQLVRALAATIEAPPSAPRPAPSVRFERAAPDTDYPESDRWIGVRFRLQDEAPAAPASTPASAAPGAAFPADLWRRPDIDPGFRSARRLALRLEAVIRVAENARRYARRYASRLARRAARPARRNPPHVAPQQTPPVARITALGPPLRPPPVETG